jgi:hypothetical protein
MGYHIRLAMAVSQSRAAHQVLACLPEPDRGVLRRGRQRAQAGGPDGASGRLRLVGLAGPARLEPVGPFAWHGRCWWPRGRPSW